MGKTLKAEARLGPQLTAWTALDGFISFLSSMRLGWQEGPGWPLSTPLHLHKPTRSLFPPACLRLRTWFTSAPVTLPSHGFVLLQYDRIFFCINISGSGKCLNQGVHPSAPASSFNQLLGLNSPLESKHSSSSTRDGPTRALNSGSCHWPSASSM